MGYNEDIGFDDRVQYGRETCCYGRGSLAVKNGVEWNKKNRFTFLTTRKNVVEKNIVPHEYNII